LAETARSLDAAYQPPSELAPVLIRVSTANSISDTVKEIVLRLAEKQLAMVNKELLC